MTILKIYLKKYLKKYWQLSVFVMAYKIPIALADTAAAVNPANNNNNLVRSSGNLGTVGDSAENVLSSLSIFEAIFKMLFYTIGIVFVFNSIIRYREYKINPSQTPISRVLSILAAGLAIAFFPFVVSFLGNKFRQSAG